MKNWSDEKLLDSTHALVDEERRITLEVIRHIREIKRRRLYAKRGFNSLWDFLIKELKLSEPAAQERLYILRLLETTPTFEKLMESGKLGLSVGALLFRISVKAKREPRELYPMIAGKTLREAKEILLTLLPGRKYREAFRELPGGMAELRIVCSLEERKQIERLRDLQSHKLLGYGEMIMGLVSNALKKLDPMTQSSPRAPEVTNPYSPHIPKHLRAEIWKRDGGACTYADPVTGRRCASTAFLQIDHIIPRALGGRNDAGNLRLLCREHNLLHAAESFGADLMESFRH